jgi:Tol biopolymer transport system component/DNA-binding winged helix-turn-helix (wHTH) protein
LQSPKQFGSVVRFGAFEVDLGPRELRKRGLKIKLQNQPFQILAMLLEQPGEVVTREQLRQKLWPDGTLVDFEHGLNAAILRLRQALGDSAESPRFVETLARHGYRFIAPVEAIPPATQRVTGSDVAVAVARSQHPRLRIVFASAGAVLLGAIALGLWLARFWIGTPDSSLVAVSLTTYPGVVCCPSFSPDGTQVAFAWWPEGPSRNCHIYVKQIGVESPFQLTNNPAPDFNPIWSPDGRTIAFFRRVAPAKWALMLIPQRGGRERAFVLFDWSRAQDGVIPSVAWTPDSKWIVCPDLTGQHTFALFLISVETNEKRKLTNPEATLTGDMAPSLSPDGGTLAFSRRGFGTDEADLYLLHLGPGFRPLGEPQKAALNNLYNYGSAWTADGREIVFGSSNIGPVNLGLWRILARKATAPTRLAFASDHASQPSISRLGNRLAYVVDRFDTNIWRVTLGAPVGKPARPAPLISSTEPEEYPAYSRDGKRIAFMSKRSGAWEIWVCDADGSNPFQLTSLGGKFAFGLRWSPDDSTIAFTVDTERKSEIYAISVNGGKHRLLIADAGQWPYWSRNGEWLYFVSIRDGRAEISKRSFKRGEAVQITHNGGDHPEESPDGKVIYFSKGWPNSLSVWRVPVGGGEEVKVIDSVHVLGQWMVGQRGIYFFSVADEQGHSDIRVYDFATGKVKKLQMIDRDIGYSIAVSPDEQTIIYPQLDQAGSNLMLVENFH